MSLSRKKNCTWAALSQMSYRVHYKILVRSKARRDPSSKLENDMVIRDNWTNLLSVAGSVLFFQDRLDNNEKKLYMLYIKTKYVERKFLVHNLYLSFIFGDE